MFKWKSWKIYNNNNNNKETKKKNRKKIFFFFHVCNWVTCTVCCCCLSTTKALKDFNVVENVEIHVAVHDVKDGDDFFTNNIWQQKQQTTKKKIKNEDIFRLWVRLSCIVTIIIWTEDNECLPPRIHVSHFTLYIAIYVRDSM